MGILLQSLVLLLIIGAGTVSLFNNFISQKSNYLARLEELDRDQIKNGLAKVVGDADSCRETLAVTPIPATLPSVSSSITLRIPSTNLPLFQEGMGIGFQQITQLDLDFIPCSLGGNCTVGGVTYTHEATLRWALRSTIGRQRSLAGTLGPILLDRNVGTGFADNCAFNVTSSGGTGTSVIDTICPALGGVLMGANCDISNRIAETLLPVANPPLPALPGSNAWQEIARRSAIEFAAKFKSKGGCFEYSAITNIDNVALSTISCTASELSSPPPAPLAECAVDSSAPPPPCKWDGSTVAISGVSFIPPGSPGDQVLFPFSCSGTEQPYAQFRGGRLQKRGCSSDPLVISPAGFPSCSSVSYSSAAGTECYRIP